MNTATDSDIPPVDAPRPGTVAPTAVRSDGIEARQRLMDAALVLFADHGFTKTSIREIALAARVNVAAISYYFGDKAGLYRAVFMDPRSNLQLTNDILQGAQGGMASALQGLLRGLMAPIKQGQAVQRCMKLHYREMLEPTGLWAEEIETDIKPAHAALVAALCQHLGVAQVDDDIHRLGFALTGLGMMLHVGADVLSGIRPSLLASPEAVDIYGDRLLTYGMAMVDAEAQRRASSAVHSSSAASAQPAGAQPCRNPQP